MQTSETAQTRAIQTFSEKRESVPVHVRHSTLMYKFISRRTQQAIKLKLSLPAWQSTSTPQLTTDSMVDTEVTRILGVAKTMQAEIDEKLGPPPEGTMSPVTPILPTSRFR